MFRLYRSTDAAQQYGQQTGQAVDKIDAAKIQSAVVALPTKHRLALSWAYIKRSNPRKAAQTIGVTMQGLRDLVNDARQMLINRGV
jgi:DNA-directed RNA polymerase specialized sigma24 family protein